jgi:hypothetical protein
LYKEPHATQPNTTRKRTQTKKANSPKDQIVVVRILATTPTQREKTESLRLFFKKQTSK